MRSATIVVEEDTYRLHARARASGKARARAEKAKANGEKANLDPMAAEKGVTPKGYKGGKGSKGKGKGYQGTCWGCGQVGHKQTECQSQGQNRVPVQGAEVPAPEQLASSVVGSVGIGSVWEVGSVDVRYESQASVQNRFDAFEEEDDEEDDDSSTAVWKQVGEEEWEM